MNTISRTLMGVSTAALIAFGGAAAMAADMVVLESKGTSIPQGTMIDGSKPIQLSAGAKLALMSADGTPVTIEGPFDGTPADKAGAGAGNGKVASALANLFASQKKSTASLGAVRSGTAGEDVVPPSPYVISVEASGPRCFSAAQPATLWRKDASQAGSLSLQGGFKMVRNASWPANADRVNLGQGFFQDGKTYQVRLNDKVVDLTTHQVPAELTKPGEIAAFMAEKGCNGQALALLAQVTR